MVIVRKKKEEEKNSKYKYIGYEIKEGMKEFKSPNIPPLLPGSITVEMETT